MPVLTSPARAFVILNPSARSHQRLRVRSRCSSILRAGQKRTRVVFGLLASIGKPRPFKWKATLRVGGGARGGRKRKRSTCGLQAHPVSGQNPGKGHLFTSGPAHHPDAHLLVPKCPLPSLPVQRIPTPLHPLLNAGSSPIDSPAPRQTGPSVQVRDLMDLVPLVARSCRG